MVLSVSIDSRILIDDMILLESNVPNNLDIST